MQYYQNLNYIFFRNKKFILKCIWNLKGPQQTKNIKTKQNKIRRLTIFYFKTYYKSTVINTVWHWHKDRDTDHWNRIENPEINPLPHTYIYVYGEMIFFFIKVPRQLNGKRTNFSTNCYWKMGYLCAKE